MSNYQSIIKFLVCVFFSLQFAQVTALNYSICDNDKLISELKSVSVDNCESEQRCIFRKDTNKTIELTFVPKEDINQVKVKITGRIGVADLPFHIKPDDACGNYGLNCPLKAGTENNFKLSLPILKIYPSINVDVSIRFVEDKKVLTCITIPARIV